MRSDSAGVRFWAGGLRLSMMGFYVIVVLLLSLFLLLGRLWWGQGDRLRSLDLRVQKMEREAEILSERGEWTLNYVRIQRGLEELGMHRIPARQRQMITERLWMMSRDYNFDPLLVLALVAHESKGNPWARGQFRSGTASGAMGLMQIKEATGSEMAESFGVQIKQEADLLKPEINLVVGTAYLMKLKARYGNLPHAIMAYNIGPAALDARLRAHTRLPVAYYDEVVRAYRKLLVRLDER